MELTEQDIKNIIASELDKYATKNQYAPSKIPFHTHNSTDSSLIDIHNIVANLSTAGAPVNVGLASSPVAGQILKATDTTHATWQNLAMTLLHSGSGTDTNAATAIVDSVALSGLTALDTILIYFTASALTQQVSGLGVWNTTDNIKLSINGNVGAGQSNGGNIILMQEQQSNKDVFTQSNSQYSSFVNTGAGAGGGTIQGFIESNTFTTAWTGSWTLGFGHEGIVAGGTLRYSWRVYKLLGQ